MARPKMEYVEVLVYEAWAEEYATLVAWCQRYSLKILDKKEPLDSQEFFAYEKAIEKKDSLRRSLGRYTPKKEAN